MIAGEKCKGSELTIGPCKPNLIYRACLYHLCVVHRQIVQHSVQYHPYDNDIYNQKRSNRWGNTWHDHVYIHSKGKTNLPRLQQETGIGQTLESMVTPTDREFTVASYYAIVLGTSIRLGISGVATPVSWLIRGFGPFQFLAGAGGSLFCRWNGCTRVRANEGPSVDWQL